MRVYEGMKLGFQALLTHVRSLKSFDVAVSSVSCVLYMSIPAIVIVFITVMLLSVMWNPECMNSMPLCGS